MVDLLAGSDHVVTIQERLHNAGQLDTLVVTTDRGLAAATRGAELLA